MSLTEKQKLFKESMMQLTDNIEEIYAEYQFARNDDVRQNIINGIHDGSINSLASVSKITSKMSPICKNNM